MRGVARGAFAVTILANMLWTTGIIKLISLFPLSKESREGWCLFWCQLGWRLTLAFSPWVQTIEDGDTTEQFESLLKKMAATDAEDIRTGKRRRPLFILANHTSFFDTVLGTAKMPFQVLWRCRTYMNNALFKLPVLGTVCRSVGHFPVHFSSSQDGVFKVNNEKMESVEKDVDKHLSNGGWLCMFPEGQMNKNPDTLLPFRFGGMKKALDYDARIVLMVFRGNETVWPLKEQVGGFPGKVRFSIRSVALDGAKSFIDSVRKEGAEDEKDMPDHALLAKRMQELMQGQYDSLTLDKLTNDKKD
jgi:1-acyl-sn-glycerol-3-phosphate acyltransferase